MTDLRTSSRSAFSASFLAAARFTSKILFASLKFFKASSNFSGTMHKAVPTRKCLVVGIR